jgi:glycosyltransferase domain-containing protein
MLTVLLPTQNRAEHCARQLRFLRRNGFPYRIVVLDGSDGEQAEAVRAACAETAEYRHFGPSFRMADKLASAVNEVMTPFVLAMPDDDVILPHAIEAALDFLKQHGGFVAAHGYFLGFAHHADDVDIQKVIGFAPSIDDDNPLRRHYDLFRRYQSFYWGVFRTTVFASAVLAARAMNVVLFRELTVMSTAVLQGKVARLPLVYALRGTAESHAALHQSHPMLWALRDTASFFQNYAAFRDAIAAFIRGKRIAVPDGVKLEQFLDMSYGTWLGREVDVGMINHTVRELLGDSLKPIRVPPWWDEWREPGEGDVVHISCNGRRRYVWRRDVFRADEVAIDADELVRVERQLDAYR